MTTKLLMAVAAVALAATAGSASAYVITAPSTLAYDNYGTSTTQGYQGTTFTTALPSDISSITFGTATTYPPSGIYAGSVTNVATSPFGSQSGPAYQNYLVAQPNGGTVTINFTTAQTSLSLLWGTVDNYNSVEFLIGGTTVTGAQIEAANPSIVNGATNEPVTISGLPAFTSIEAITTGIAFEFDTATQVPEPSSLALLGAGLFGVGFIAARRKRAGAAAA